MIQNSKYVNFITMYECFDQQRCHSINLSQYFVTQGSFSQALRMLSADSSLSHTQTKLLMFHNLLHFVSPPQVWTTPVIHSIITSSWNIT